MKGWNDNDLDQLRRLVKEGKTDAEIAVMMGRSVASVEHQTRGLREKATPTIQDNQPTTTIEITDEAIINALNKRLEKLGPYKLDVSRKSRRKGKGETLVIHLTDLHAGKIVKDQNSRIIYNEHIFRHRMDQYTNQALKLLDNNITKGTPITDVVVVSTGDLANGEEIYETQAYEQELAPPNQVMLVVEVLIKLILALIGRGLPVRFYGVKGNHGRTGKDTDPSSNWDSMIYKILELWAREKRLDGKVRICYAEDTDFLTFDIRGHKYLIRHKAPETCDTSSGRVKFNTWAKEHEASAIVYGHFHHFGVSDVDGVRVFRGGSTVGGDSLSDSMAKYSEPIQLVWGVTEERVMTFFYAVDLGGKDK